ncbi:MAG: dihydrolipoamide acetyltransferase family protein [Candidatus Sulfotelmatobacter sp.]
MTTKIIMPKLGMEMTNGNVVSWFFKEGDQVNKGQVIVQIETDKITYDIEASTSGLLRRILVCEGGMVPVGGVIGVIGSEDELLDERAFVEDEPLPPLGMPKVVAHTPQGTKVGESDAQQAARIVATPAARKVAREKGVDLSAVTGSGPAGRILERDVLGTMGTEQEPAKHTDEEMAWRLDASRPVTRMRAIIAERLTNSWKAPHIYLMTEVDAGEIQNLRAEALREIERQTGYQLSYDDILIRVVAMAVEKRPLLNARWESDHIKIPGEINIGLAVALEDGLVVLVIRDANKNSLVETVRLRGALVAKARARKLALDDLRGGTFSISNLGMFDIDCFTAILNPPESGILAAGRIKDVPVVAGGKVVVRPVMKLVLGVDHRVVDGAVAAAFLQEIKEMLEIPRQYI